MNAEMTSATSKCNSCAHASGAAVPTTVGQPFLDALAFSNPETLRQALGPEEVVLVQCRASVGGLVGTNRRVLAIKDGQAHELRYTDVQDITVEKAGWWLSAVCQLVTAAAPHQALKVKAADKSTTAFSLVRAWMPIFELAKSRILDIRDARRCRHCGAFTPLEGEELRVAGRTDLMEPIPSGGSEVLAPRLLPGERILLQAHGVRYYKSIIVTEQRVLFVLGRAESQFHAHALSTIQGVEVEDYGLKLRITGRPFEMLNAGSLVQSDTGLPANDVDLDDLKKAADLIDGLIRNG